MRRARGAALATLMIVSAVRAQLEQEPFLETVEGSSISIKCSHPNIQRGDFIHWYRQLPGKGPELVVMTVQASKEVRSPEGRLTVSADRRRSALWLGRPRRGDAAVYYCALGPRAEEPGLRPGTNRRGRGRAGPAGGAAAPARPGLRHRDRHRHRQWTSAPEPAPPRTQAPVAIPVLAPTTAPTPAPAPAFSHRPCSAPLLSPGCVRLSCSSHQTAPPGHSYMCTL
ncbi:mitogen-activated protein kinase 7-like [Passer montanus]|nr:mitogen-activated protein kinase 7-like [Passer montanus]